MVFFNHFRECMEKERESERKKEEASKCVWIARGREGEKTYNLEVTRIILVVLGCSKHSYALARMTFVMRTIPEFLPISMSS